MTKTPAELVEDLLDAQCEMRVADVLGDVVLSTRRRTFEDAKSALLAAIPPPLTWAREKPKEPGWFWVKMPRTTRTVQIVLDADDHLIIDWPGNWDWLVEYEWAGPIPQPQAGV